MVDNLNFGLREYVNVDTIQVIMAWKQSTDLKFEAKKNQILELKSVADGTTRPNKGDRTVVICRDWIGPLNLQPYPARSGHRWQLVRVTRPPPSPDRSREAGVTC